MSENALQFYRERGGSARQISIRVTEEYPRDVEEVLHRYPAVADAVVVGVPDPDLGEVVKAYVALKPGRT